MASMEHEEGDVDTVDITFDFGAPDVSKAVDLTLDLEGGDYNDTSNIELKANGNSAGDEGIEDVDFSKKSHDFSLNLGTPTITIQAPSPMAESPSSGDDNLEYTPAVVTTEAVCTTQTKDKDVVEFVNGAQENGEKDDDFEFDAPIPTAKNEKQEDEDEFDFEDLSAGNTNATSITTTPQPSSGVPSVSVTTGGGKTNTQSVVVERSADLKDIEFDLNSSVDTGVNVASQGIKTEADITSTPSSKSVEREEAHSERTVNSCSKHNSQTEQHTSENTESQSIDGTKPKTTSKIKGVVSEPPTTTESVPEKTESVKAAEAEWALVQEVTPDMSHEEGMSMAAPKRPANFGTTPFLSYRELLEYVRNCDMSPYKSQIKVSVPRKGFAGLLHNLFGTKLNKSLHSDRDLIFCVAAYPFVNEEPIHIQALQSIYRRLTGSKFDCPRFGGHWEQIGFQGNDPSTDLRGCGFLGLFHLIYLLSDPKYLALAKDIYKLAQHETQNFPFCIMSINITRIAIQALRGDCLNKECNRAKDVLGLLNEFYVAVYYNLYTTWKSGNKTIADTGYVMRDLEASVKKNPRIVLRNLEGYLEQKRGATGGGAVGETALGSSGTGGTGAGQDLKITTFGEMEKGLQE